MSDVYTRFDVTTKPEGQAHIRMETNDDDDDGCPDTGPLTVWEDDTLMDIAMAVAGNHSRTGLWGQPVDVFLDGKKI